MNFRRLNSLFLAALLGLAAASCKKDDEEVVILYLDGTMKVEVPEFVLANEVVTMVPEGVTHPDDKGIGYYWKVTPVMTGYDTTRFESGLNAAGKPSDGAFTFQFPDSLGTYTVYGYAFADGYSSSSVNKSVTVVDPDKSITGKGISPDEDPYVTVNGRRYYYTTIGGRDWFKQNMAFTESGVPFRNGKPMDGVFGLFYNHEDALKICPEGWRLPTLEDWAALGTAVTEEEDDAADYTYSTIPGIAGKLMTNAYFNENRMWEYWPSVGKITNSSGICMIPEGFANLGEKDSEGNYPFAKFTGAYEYAVFWTADIADDGMAYYRYIYCEEPDFMMGKGDINTFGASVRCVRDASVNN